MIFKQKKYNIVALIVFLLVYLGLFFIPYCYDTMPLSEFQNTTTFHSVYSKLMFSVKWFRTDDYSAAWLKWEFTPMIGYFLGLLLLITDIFIYIWKNKNFCLYPIGYAIAFIGFCIGIFPGYASYIHAAFYISLLIPCLWCVTVSIFTVKKSSIYLTWKNKKQLNENRIAALEKELTELKAEKKDGE